MILENKKDRIIIKPKSVPVITVSEDGDPTELFLAICEAINEGGYDPISQIAGYLISEDPTHIANYKNARALIGKIDRDDLLNEMIKYYIDGKRREAERKSKRHDD